MGNAVPPLMHRRRTGRAPNRPESAQANASPMGTTLQQARRVRRGGGGGAAAARRPPPGLRHAAPRTGAAVHAQTAVFGVRRRTRGMVCASHCAQSVAAVGRQRVGRERTTSPFTARGGAPHAALTTTWLATHCEFGFARTPPSVGRNGGAGPTADPGEGRGASPPALPGRARARPRYVGCGLSSHRTHACIGRIPLRFYSSAFAASTDGA